MLLVTVSDDANQHQGVPSSVLHMLFAVVDSKQNLVAGSGFQHQR
jgi:hypothetical protein